MSKFEASDLKKLQENLTQELESFEQIKKLTEKIAEQIDTEKIEALDKSLSKRQELIEKINGLHQESNPLMQSYVQASGLKNSEVDRLVERIRETTQICAKLNDENINTIKAMSEEQVDKIDKQSAKRKGISGYAQAIAYSPEVIDKKT